MLKVTTESGAVYLIDEVNKRWSSSSKKTRDPGGVLEFYNEPRIGWPLVIIGPPLDPKMNKRVVKTSPVVAIEIENGGIQDTN
jgi:hypothetical protein